MKIIHIILPSACYLVPIVSVCDSIVQVIHIARWAVCLTNICILAANHNPPVIICRPGYPGIPGVVCYFNATMKIGSHHKIVLSREIHKCNSFRLPCISIGMLAILRIGIIAVKIDTINVIPSGSTNRTVPSIVSTVGIGQGININLHIVNQICSLLIGAIILKQVFNQLKHQHVAGSFITMNG